MEAIGGAASLAGLITSIQTAAKLYDFFSSVREAPEEIQNLCTRLGSLHKTLLEVRRVICDGPGSSAPNSTASIIQSLEVCARCFDRVNVLFDAIGKKPWRSCTHPRL